MGGARDPRHGRRDRNSHDACGSRPPSPPPDFRYVRPTLEPRRRVFPTSSRAASVTLALGWLAACVMGAVLGLLGGGGSILTGMSSSVTPLTDIPDTGMDLDAYLGEIEKEKTGLEKEQLRQMLKKWQCFHGIERKRYKLELYIFYRVP